MTSNDLVLALTLVLVTGCGGNATSNSGGRSGAGGSERGGASSGGKTAASSGGAGLFACDTLRCTEQQYCVQSSHGPAATPVSYSCNPPACTDGSCLTMTDCTCGGTDGQLTLVCQQA